MKLRYFTRDLAWLTLVIALALGWWLDRSRQSYAVKTFPDGSAVLTEKATMRNWTKSGGMNVWIELFPAP